MSENRVAVGAAVPADVRDAVEKLARKRDLRFADLAGDLILAGLEHRRLCGDRDAFIR